eukprot:3626086-Pyramimonas_sp.AAC.1
MDGRVRNDSDSIAPLAAPWARLAPQAWRQRSLKRSLLPHPRPCEEDARGQWGVLKHLTPPGAFALIFLLLLLLLL